VVWLVAAACGDSKPAEPAPEPLPSPAAPAPQPPAPKPLTVREIFDIPFGVTVTHVRMDTTEGPCRVGIEYRSTTTLNAHRSLDVWGFAPGAPAETTCEPGASKSIPVMFRALEQLAGLGTGTLALDADFGKDRPTVERYFAAIKQLPPDADEGVVAKRLFDQNVFAAWQPFIDGLGYRVTEVDLFMLEPMRDHSGPIPPRVPRRVSLVLEPKGPIVTRGDRTTAPRTMKAVFGIPFEISLELLGLRAEGGACKAELEVRAHGLRIDVVPDSCEMTKEHMEKELPAMFFAGAELIGRAPTSEIAMGSSFSVLPVMEKWIPAVRGKKFETDYKKLTARMIEARVFAHLDPFITAIGLKLTDVSIEKLSSESGAALLATHPSLASTGLIAKDRIPVPMMTALILTP